MTSPAERNIALSRGMRAAAPAADSRRKALEAAGLHLTWLDDINVIVERQYRFNLTASSWHRIDDPIVHGYLVGTLLADLKKRVSPNPAEGRDSGAEPRTIVRQMTGPALAESSAGSPSTSLLPETSWP